MSQLTLMSSVRPQPGYLWTSAEAARAFRVGVSSIKRWTDEGELEAIRTPGGHRRYTLTGLHRFASIRGLGTDRLPPLTPFEREAAVPPPADVTILQALVTGDAQTIRGFVVPRVSSVAKRATFFDRVIGEAMREIGFRWEGGVLGVDEEHRASHLLTEAVERIRPELAFGSRPLAFLACPPDELHELPLHLVRLIFEWSGWRTELAGASLPWQSARAAIERDGPAIVAFSARSGAPFQTHGFESLVRWCGTRSAHVIVGGEWARGGPGEVDGYRRFRTLRGFERWLRTL